MPRKIVKRCVLIKKIVVTKVEGVTSSPHDSAGSLKETE